MLHQVLATRKEWRDFGAWFLRDRADRVNSGSVLPTGIVTLGELHLALVLYHRSPSPQVQEPEPVHAPSTRRSKRSAHARSSSRSRSARGAIGPLFERYAKMNVRNNSTFDQISHSNNAIDFREFTRQPIISRYTSLIYLYISLHLPHISCVCTPPSFIPYTFPSHL